MDYSFAAATSGIASLADDPRQDEAASVRHLVDLGYVDPDEEAIRRAAFRRKLNTELRHPVEIINQGRGPEAIGLLDRLAAEDPDWFPPHQLLAEIKFRGGDWRAARSHLDWLAHHNIVTPRLALMAATIALESRDLHAALADLEYAAHVNPKLATVQSLLGTVQMQLSRWEAAADTFERAVRQNPADARALDGLAAVALHRRDFEKAAHWALKALEHDMRMFRAHYHLGRALLHLDRPIAAIEAFTACTRIDPSRAAPFRWLSRIAKHQQRDDARAADYQDQGRKILQPHRGQASGGRPKHPPDWSDVLIAPHIDREDDTSAPTWPLSPL